MASQEEAVIVLKRSQDPVAWRMITVVICSRHPHAPMIAGPLLWKMGELLPQPDIPKDDCPAVCSG